uniref:Uncharacterized protein n=1 Tax=Calcidiscus leptoporus TaxID=127549 RepID=A0A7S0J032_9EUKA
MGLKPDKHFVKVTIPGSLLDAALQPPVSSLVHQPDGLSTAAGRHDYVTHGMLLPLSLCGGSVADWCRGLDQSDDAVAYALELAEFIYSQASQGRWKIALLLPLAWRGRWEEGEWRDTTQWFKQHIEESLGKIPGKLLKMVTTLDEAQLLASPQPADMAVVVVRVGAVSVRDDASLTSALSESRLPLFVFELATRCRPSVALPKLMHAFTVVKFELARRYGFCAVDQPPVETYKRLVAKMRSETGAVDGFVKALRAGDLLSSRASSAAIDLCVPAESDQFADGWQLSFGGALGGDAHAGSAELAAEMQRHSLDASKWQDVLVGVHLLATRRHGCGLYGEYIYYGNLSQGDEAQALRTLLVSEGAHMLWRGTLGSFADVGKGPAVGHSTHAMGKQGSVLTLALLPSEHATPHASLAAMSHEYQEQNALAAVMALAGYDLDTNGELCKPGHDGLALLLRIPRNDAASRAVLCAALRRVGDVLRSRRGIS